MENAPQSSPQVPRCTITTASTNKGKLMLTVDGYQFQLKSFNSKKTMKFWRCSNRSCGVILHTNLTNEFVRFSGSFGEHCHLPNPVETEVRGLRESMRKRAETELVPLQQIAEDEVRQKLLSGEALAILPNITNLGHSLGYKRRKLIPLIPQSSSFSLPDIYKTDYLNVNRLLLHDNEDPQFQTAELSELGAAGRILIWSTDIQLKLLFETDQLHMDGTFCTAPPHFNQVLIVQAIRHGTCVPVVYALLPDRKAITYVYVFNVLLSEARKLGKNLQPSLIMTDFEGGLTKAISMEFPSQTVQKGCFFHFCKAVYRNVQSEGLSTAYLENMVIRSLIRNLMALALVPEQHVQSLFDELVEGLSDGEREEIDGLLKYFNTYWMRQIPSWNVFNLTDRTNNYSEGYNHRFKRRLNKIHPNIWCFIDSLKKEVDTVHQLIFQIEVGMAPRTKRTQSRLAEKRISELYTRFDNETITVKELLRGLSFFVVKK